MKDRRATGNKFQQGVAPAEYNKSERLTQGVPMHWGEKRDEGLASTRGVPHVGTGKISAVIPKCGSLTRAGEACKARPVHGENFCIGHLRANESRGD